MVSVVRQTYALLQVVALHSVGPVLAAAAALSMLCLPASCESRGNMQLQTISGRPQGSVMQHRLRLINPSNFRRHPGPSHFEWMYILMLQISQTQHA